MNISVQLEKLRAYKRSLGLQKKATNLTGMERVIQRIATRVLKARFDEEQLNTVVMVSDRMLVGALLGIPAERALDNRDIEKTLVSLGGSTGIMWKPLMVTALKPYMGIPEDLMEDLIGKCYTRGSQTPAYIAGTMVANLSKSVKVQLEEKAGSIATAFKMKVVGIAKDLIKSNPYELSQNTESMYDETGNVTNPVVRGEMEMLESWGDEKSDADTFIQLIMFDSSRLAQQVRDYVLPLIKNELVGHFVSSKKIWSRKWAEDEFADPSDGMFLYPPSWRSFKGSEYLRDWVYKKVKTPSRFNQFADSVRGEYQARVEGSDLYISGLNLGSAIGGKSVSFIMTCSFGKFQSKIHNVYVKGGDLLIPNWTKTYGDKPVSVISDVHFLSMKTEATFINDRVKKYPQFIENMFDMLMENAKWKKDLFAKMLTSQTFSRSLQAKLKKASARKNKHTNVPF